MTDIYGYDNKKLNIIMFNMSAFYDWEHGIVNRNYYVLNELAKSDKVNKIIAVDFLPLRLKKTIKHYFQNILGQARKHEMIFGDLTSVCYQKSEKIWVYSTIDSFFSPKKVARELKKIQSRLNLHNVVYWSYNPFFTQFIDILEKDFFVFDAVDNWSAHPSYLKLMSREKILNNYKKIAGKADLIFTVAEELLGFYENFGRTKDVHWIPNGVDFEHYNNETLLARKNVLSEIKQPVIGYMGTIQERIDLDLLVKIANANPDKVLALCGPVWPSIAAEVKEKLATLTNVILPGRIAFDDAPGWISRFDVGIIPHKIDEFIKSTNPMKMYEYLACGKPVVSTPGAGIEMFKDEIYIANDEREFLEKIDLAFKEDSPEKRANRKKMVGAHSYENRVKQMLELLIEKIKPTRDAGSA